MADIAALRERVNRYGITMQKFAALDMAAQATSAAPVKTGALRNSRRISQGYRSTRIEFTAPQGEWTDRGTAAHRINGRPLLVFFWPKVGRVVFLRHVNHPGNKGSRWFSNVMTSSNWQAALRRAQPTAAAEAS